MRRRSNPRRAASCRRSDADAAADRRHHACDDGASSRWRSSDCCSCCSACLRCWPSCCRRSASTASSRRSSVSARRRSACAWRSAPAASQVIGMVLGQSLCPLARARCLGLVGAAGLGRFVRGPAVRSVAARSADAGRQRVDARAGGGRGVRHSRPAARARIDPVTALRGE